MEERNMLLEREEELLKLVNNHTEIIIFGAGLCGSVLVRYLVAKGYAEKIFCVAVSDTSGNPDNLMGIPVCALTDIRERGSTALVVIATFEGLHEEIRGALKRDGFRNVATLRNVCYAEIRRTCSDYSAEIYSETRRILAELKYGIAEQHEVVAVNTAAFGGYKDFYVGRELVIVAPGMTLNDYEPIEGTIHIGMNKAYKYRKLTLDYYFAQDFNRNAIKQLFGENALKEYIRDIAELRCKKFIGSYLGSSPHKFIQLSESDFTRMNAVRYFVDTAPSKEIAVNICMHPLMDFFSIVFPVVHFALFTNPRRIYLVGCDLLADGKYKYFDGYEAPIEKWFLSHVEFLKNTGWPKVKAFAAQYYPDTEIVSVNPVGLKGLFRDVYTK